jgi:hypothetical protein
MQDASGEFEGRGVCPEDRPEPRPRAEQTRCATPSTIPTRGASWMPSLPDPLARPERRTRDAFDGESAEALREMLRRSPRGFGYDTRARGLRRWPHRRASRRGSYTRRRVSVETIRGAPDGAPSRGSLAQSQAVDHLPPPLVVRKRKRRRDRPMEVAAPKSPDTWQRWVSRGRVPVEPGGSLCPPRAELLRGGQADSPRPAVGGQRGPRAQGRILLRTLPAGDRPDVAERFVDGAGARERHNDPVPRVVPREARRDRQEGLVVLIRDDASWHRHISEEVRRWLARKTRSPSRGERRRSEDRGLSSARAEPVARRDRARAGTRQAQGRRTRRPFGSIRACREGMQGFGCPHYEHPSVPQKVA